jgi:hypothetical protein
MLVLALSALAIAALTGIAWLFGFHARPVLDGMAAIAEAEGRLAGFRAREVQLADDGRGALLRGADGRVALVLPLGDGWVVRRVPPSAVASDGTGAVSIRLDEPMLRSARLPMSRPPLWLRGPA